MGMAIHRQGYGRTLVGHLENGKHAPGTKKSQNKVKYPTVLQQNRGNAVEDAHNRNPQPIAIHQQRRKTADRAEKEQQSKQEKGNTRN